MKKKISRLFKKNVCFSGVSWSGVEWETLGTRKDYRHKYGYCRRRGQGKVGIKKQYKKIWNRRYRSRPLEYSHAPHNKYTDYWEYD